jgi:uncharacterized protein (TIGR02145 family)
MKKDKLFLLIIFLTAILFLTSGYAQTVTIGNQIWTSKNLDLATYRNGDLIPQVQDEEAWANLTTGAWCYYKNDTSNGIKYGKLYNWYAVHDSRGLAPKGFHIPTDAEWTTLINYLGGEIDAGTKLKSALGWKRFTSGGSKTCPKCKSWNVEYRKKVTCHTCKDMRYVSAPITMNSGNGSNYSGFSGLPGGDRYFDGSYNTIGYLGFWWSSSEFDTSYAWFRTLGYSYGDAFRHYNFKRFGFSVRCIMD